MKLQPMRFTAIFTAAVLLAACATQDEFQSAITKVDLAWKAENDATLARDGSRLVSVSRSTAFTAARASVRQLGMVIERQDPATGFLFASAPAPVPLTEREWNQVQTADTGKMRNIASGEVGILGWLATLDPTGKDVLLNILVTEKAGRSEVALGLRLRNNANQVTGLAKRTQAPPTAVRIGVQKFWDLFGAEVAARSGVRRKEATFGESADSLTTAGSSSTVDMVMEDAALDLWRGFPSGQTYKIAVSAIKPQWMNISDLLYRRANNSLERALNRTGQGRGSSLLARSTLMSLIDTLEKEGLGTGTDRIRRKLLAQGLADVLVVADYYAAPDGVDMSIQAVRIVDGQVLTTSREYHLPIKMEAADADPGT